MLPEDIAETNVFQQIENHLVLRGQRVGYTDSEFKLLVAPDTNAFYKVGANFQEGRDKDYWILTFKLPEWMKSNRIEVEKDREKILNRR